MKRRLAILGLAGLLPLAAHAYQFRVGETTNALVLPAGAQIAEEALWAANSVEIQGTTLRDLWLLASAGVRFDGESRGDLRAFAAAATIGGTVQGNLFAYANGLQLTTNSAVRGEAALFGADLICEGAVEGNARIFAKSATLGGRWGGDVRIYADEIRIAPGTRIAGNLVYTSSKPLVYDASVAVGGTVEQRNVLPPEAPLRARIARHGYLFLAALLVGMPFVGFFPHVAGGAVRRLRATPGRALLTGAATLLLAPFVIGFAFMTAIGIPVALLAGALYLALAYLSHIVAALWLGHRLLRPQGPQTFARVLAALATGLFVFYFAAAIPGVAAFLLPAVAILGTGALVLALLQRPSFAVPLPPPPPPPVLNPPPEPPQQE